MKHLKAVVGILLLLGLGVMLMRDAVTSREAAQLAVRLDSLAQEHTNQQRAAIRAAAEFARENALLVMQLDQAQEVTEDVINTPPPIVEKIPPKDSTGDTLVVFRLADWRLREASLAAAVEGERARVRAVVQLQARRITELQTQLADRERLTGTTLSTGREAVKKIRGPWSLAAHVGLDIPTGRPTLSVGVSRAIISF